MQRLFIGFVLSGILRLSSKMALGCLLGADICELDVKTGGIGVFESFGRNASLGGVSARVPHF